AVLAGPISHGRPARGRCGIDVVSRLLPEGRRVDSEFLRRAREPGRDRLLAPFQYRSVWAPQRCPNDRRGIHRLADGVTPNVCGRAWLRSEVGYGLDARHAQVLRP